MHFLDVSSGIVGPKPDQMDDIPSLKAVFSGAKAQPLAFPSRSIVQSIPLKTSRNLSFDRCNPFTHDLLADQGKIILDGSSSA
jgi:hypothetical protein